MHGMMGGETEEGWGQHEENSEREMERDYKSEVIKRMCNQVKVRQDFRSPKMINIREQ